MTGGMPRWAFVPGEVLRPILPRSVSDRESPCQMICSEEPLATTGDHVAATRDDGARKGPAKIVEQRRRAPHGSAFDGGSARVARTEHSCEGAMAAWMPEVPETVRHGSTAGLPCLALREQL
jgi:hypothetical protein